VETNFLKKQENYKVMYCYIIKIFPFFLKNHINFLYRKHKKQANQYISNCIFHPPFAYILIFWLTSNFIDFLFTWNHHFHQHFIQVKIKTRNIISPSSLANFFWTLKWWHHLYTAHGFKIMDGHQVSIKMKPGLIRYDTILWYIIYHHFQKLPPPHQLNRFLISLWTWHRKST